MLVLRHPRSSATPLVVTPQIPTPHNVRWLILNDKEDGAIAALARLAMGNGRGASTLQESKRLIQMWMKQLQDPEHHTKQDAHHPKSPTHNTLRDDHGDEPQEGDNEVDDMPLLVQSEVSDAISTPRGELQKRRARGGG